MLEILQHVNNAVYAYDLKGHLIFFNTAAERLFGVRADQVQQTNVFSLMAPEWVEAARLFLSNELIGGTGAPQHLVLRTATGEQECEVLTILVFDRNGNPIELFSVVSPLFSVTIPAADLQSLLHQVGVNSNRGMPARATLA